MYEEQTFEAIMERQLDRIPAGLDKRQGSIIYDALAPAAWELTQMYAELERQVKLKFAAESTGEDLDKAVAWSGIKRKAATKAVFLGLFEDSAHAPFDVPIGSRFSVSGLNYKVTEKLADGQFKLECETAGAAGNEVFGSLLPLDYIAGMAYANLSQLLVPGEDEESDEQLLERYQDKISRPITSGNRYQYELWAREVNGVGKAKAFPLWDGPGTVKVALLGTDMQAPPSAVVDAVQAYIDPLQDGTGEGVAPIGAAVTIVAAVEVPINVSVEVTLASGAVLSQVKEQLESGVREYLKALAFADSLVRYTRIANVILDIPPIIDYTNLTVNGGTGNIEIDPGAVAVLGTVTVNE